MASLVSGVAKLNPFKKSTHEDDDEDIGEQIDSATIAGGGHSSRQTVVTKNQLNISPALKSFLVKENIVRKEEASLDNDQLSGPLRALLDKPHIKVPSEVTNRSHPLPDYYISSSHNTYLMAHQLYGSSSASGYEAALSAGARCVEIDAWDDDGDKDEPKVTHGFTLVSFIKFRAVCETIRDVVDSEGKKSIDSDGYRAAPILISLENHCGPHGQLRMVQIMREVWGDRLLSKAVRDKGTEEQQGKSEHVRLDELGSKICVIVEYHLPNETDDTSSSSSSSSSEDEEEKTAREQYKKNKQAAATGIIPELAELGIYAQSVKPADNSWFEEDQLKNSPHHPLINLSESALASHMPKESERIARNNAHHLMRVYPKGTRISSANLKPVPFWNIGAQICALNWQTFGASMQINEALFSGSDGYVLKPAALRSSGSGQGDTGATRRLRLHIAGASDLPVPEGRNGDDLKPYISCTLVHPDDLQGNPPKRKTKPYKQSKISGLLSSGDGSNVTNPIWDENLDWEYKDNDMVFLRILLKSDDSFARNPILAVAAVRLMYVVEGWSFIRLLNLKGEETTCSLLVKFDIERS